MPYFDEPVGRVKIQTTSKNSQRYYTTKRLIRDLLSNAPNFMSVRENFAYIYLRGVPDRSKRSGTELARKIQLTDWSTAGNLSNRSSGVQIPRDISTRFRRYLYSTKCSWTIKLVIFTSGMRTSFRNEKASFLSIFFYLVAFISSMNSVQ